MDCNAAARRWGRRTPAHLQRRRNRAGGEPLPRKRVAPPPSALRENTLPDAETVSLARLCLTDRGQRLHGTGRARPVAVPAAPTETAVAW
jgi:hypothetical protein